MDISHCDQLTFDAYHDLESVICSHSDKIIPIAEISQPKVALLACSSAYRSSAGAVWKAGLEFPMLCNIGKQEQESSVNGLHKSCSETDY